MLSLYEILKASKTGLAPDMWTALAGMNWGSADSGHEVKELTGIPPLSFTADGTPLLDYLISGNMSQTGTPTPSNPVDVQGVGVRTENLWNEVYTGISSSSVTYFPIYVGSGDFTLSTTTRKTESSIPKQNGNANIFFLTGNVSSGAYTSGNGVWNGQNRTVTATDGYVTIAYRYLEGDSGSDPRNNDTMLNTGSTAKPYEPYGYKIPISSGGVTTNIYLGSTQTTRKIKKRVFRGLDSDGWYYNSSIGDYDTYRTNATSDKLSSANKVLCTHFPNYGSNERIEAYEKSLYIYVKRSEIGSLTQFIQFLQQQYANGTPVTVWYVLAAPETAIVNEPLMKIGDYADTLSMEQAGVQIPTLHGNTVIDVLTELKPSQMYIKYQK